MKLRPSLYLAAAVAFFAGWQTSQWYAHCNQPVHAQGDTVFYQFQNVSGASAVTLYYPDRQTIYVYPSVAVGNNIRGCAFSLKLGKPGDPIRRDQCPIVSR
jgi:hypothetical protein